MSHDVMAAADLPEGSQRCQSVGKYNILFCHTETGFYAFENLCSHAAQPLAEGEINEDVITCPVHGAKFNVTTGKPVNAPRLAMIKSFEVKVEEGRILIDID